MTADLLTALRAQGFTLAVEGDHIRVTPSSRLTAALRDAIRAHRAELLAVLDGARADLAELPPVAAAPLADHVWPCCYFAHRRRWRSIHGVVLCGECAPPAHAGVVAAWLDGEPSVLPPPLPPRSDAPLDMSARRGAAPRRADRAAAAQALVAAGAVVAEGAGVYRVHGQQATYTVRLGDRPSCTCPDFCVRRVACKHVLAAAAFTK